MSLTLYLFYMVLFIGLLAAALFFWLSREEDDGEGREDADKGSEQ